MGNEGARRERTDAGELKARVCLPWPRWAERRRRAAVAASTRRAMPEAGRPSSWAIQLHYYKNGLVVPGGNGL